MYTLPNFISLIRLPLAFCFLSENVFVRCFALILAGISDVLDGYLARKLQKMSYLGTILDPIMDKFFVLFALGVFISEGQITIWDALAMLSRDIALLCFGSYLSLKGTLPTYRFRAIWWGKASTFLQFIVLIALACYFTIPPYVFATFIAIGVCALIELLTRDLAET